MNRYIYCRNNPEKFIDKNGHFAWLAITTVIGAAIGAVSYWNAHPGDWKGTACAGCVGAVAGFVTGATFGCLALASVGTLTATIGEATTLTSITDAAFSAMGGLSLTETMAFSGIANVAGNLYGSIASGAFNNAGLLADRPQRFDESDALYDFGIGAVGGLWSSTTDLACNLYGIRPILQYTFSDLASHIPESIITPPPTMAKGSKYID